jgi:hypothetical protein
VDLKAELEGDPVIMECVVIVRAQSEGRYVARPLGLPELESCAPTEAEAIEQVKQKLDDWLHGAKVVEVTVPTGNPWLDTFGRSADDPHFEEYQKELERIRSDANAG